MNLSAGHKLRLVEEEVRTLRAKLLTRMAHGEKIFVIASARPGEGKSTVTALLAKSMAGLRKVLVIEADMRRPRVAALFGMRGSSGLSQLGSARPLNSLAETVHGVYVVPAGATHHDPQQLFSGEAFRNGLQAVRSEYDVVLIDTPPVLACADAVVLASMSDGVLLVARCGGVTIAEAVETRKRFDSAGVPIIGGIFMGGSDTTPYANYTEQAEPEPERRATSILAITRAVGSK